MIPTNLLVWIYIVTALLVAVVAVGLWQHSLDVTPVAVTLSGVLSGVIGSALLRVHRRDDDEK